MANLFTLSTNVDRTSENGQTFTTSKSLTTIIDCQRLTPIQTISTTLSINNNNNHYFIHHENQKNIEKQSKTYRSYENILRPQNISTSTNCINTSTNYERNLCENYCNIGDEENFMKTNLKLKSTNSVAKKGKFWKFLEDEKWKKKSADDLPKINCGKGGFSRWRKHNQKSSSELYREAAQLLGLSCTLTDSCRCIECQSRYFDYEDSDSPSETSIGIQTELLFSREHNLTVPVLRYRAHRSLETLSLPNTPQCRKRSSKCESLSDMSTDDGNDYERT